MGSDWVSQYIWQRSGLWVFWTELCSVLSVLSGRCDLQRPQCRKPHQHHDRQTHRHTQRTGTAEPGTSRDLTTLSRYSRGHMVI